MVDASSFADAVRALSGELQMEPYTPIRLNQLAARIDHLGRRVHGLGWVRDHEIGACLSAAVGELSEAPGLSGDDRAESVTRAIVALEAALTHMKDGLRPRQP